MQRDPMHDGDLEDVVSRSEIRKGVAIVLGLALVVIALIVREAVLQARVRSADEQVHAWCRQLDADKDAAGRWRNPVDAPLPERDPWGGQLSVQYARSPHAEELTVRSDGPDRRRWTSDDLTCGATNTDWLALAKDGAEAVEGVAGAASRGLVGGAIEGVTDHLPKKVRDGLGIPSDRDKPAGTEKK